jgi:LPS-assembly protein
MDDCLILALNYVTNYSYGSGTAVLNHTVMLQLSLRTLGGTTVSQALTQSGN